MLLLLITCVISTIAKPAVNLNKNGYVSNFGLNKYSQSYQNEKVLPSLNLVRLLSNGNYTQQVNEVQQKKPAPKNVYLTDDPTAKSKIKFSN